MMIAIRVFCRRTSSWAAGERQRAYISGMECCGDARCARQAADAWKHGKGPGKQTASSLQHRSACMHCPSPASAYVEPIRSGGQRDRVVEHEPNDNDHQQQGISQDVHVAGFKVSDGGCPDLKDEHHASDDERHQQLCGQRVTGIRARWKVRGRVMRRDDKLRFRLLCRGRVEAVDGGDALQDTAAAVTLTCTSV